jgi:hypothetical protein
MNAFMFILPVAFGNLVRSAWLRSVHVVSQFIGRQP